jgi:hypothetical protein
MLDNLRVNHIRFRSFENGQHFPFAVRKNKSKLIQIKKIKIV